MKKLIVLTFLLLLAGCKSASQERINKATARIPEVRQFVIQKLEVTDQAEIAFINTTKPEFQEVNKILYYWFKDNTGKAIYTVQTQPGDDFHIFSASKN